MRSRQFLCMGARRERTKETAPSHLFSLSLFVPTSFNSFDPATPSPARRPNAPSPLPVGLANTLELVDLVSSPSPEPPFAAAAGAGVASDAKVGKEGEGWTGDAVGRGGEGWKE
jgi:hypothetical protein